MCAYTDMATTHKDYFLYRQKKLSSKLQNLRQDPTLLLLSTKQLIKKKSLHDSIQAEASEILQWHRRIHKSTLNAYTQPKIDSNDDDDDFHSVQSSLDSDEEEIVVDRMPRDGNCFFHACSKVLKCTHIEVRHRCTQYLRQHAGFRRKYGISMNDVKHLEGPGHWNNHAMDFIPKIVADLYNVVVDIHHHQCFRPPHPSKTVIWLQYEDNHYNLIIKQ